MNAFAISVALATAAVVPVFAVTVQPRAEVLDRTRAIQHAIDQCPRNGSVNFAPGIYSVATLQLKPACTYRGEPGKSILKLTARNRFIFDFSERSDVRIEGLVFDATEGMGLSLRHGDSAIVRSNTIDNSDGVNNISGMWKDGTLFACNDDRNRCDSSGLARNQFVNLMKGK